ncbi:hypothetical protein GQ53DRAFT_848014 [Thozetella sp. PMI_491]|nr:hypothetical protein GQ53DRAFT_848014 [Thozetella sp. PMI_491]
MPKRPSLGCITCKVRRVKCDQTKPACRRCQVTGRQCDGYLDGNANLSGRALAAAARNQSSVAPLSQVLTSVSARRRPGDSMLFDLFRIRTAPTSAKFMPSQFWTHELLRLAHSEPAIWHATLALAALHQRWETAEAWRIPHSSPARDGGEDGPGALTRLAEEHYARSISLTRGMTSSIPVLTLSLALSTAANLMGRLDQSRMHLMAGRRILVQEGKTERTQRAAEMMLRLDFEAMTFSEQTAPYQYEDTEPLRRLGFSDYGSLENYEDAAAALFSLMRIMMLVGEIPTMEAGVITESFLLDIQLWEQGMARLEAMTPPTDENLLPRMSLRMYHTLFRLFSRGDMDSFPQTRLDAHLGLFTRTLTLTEGIVRRQKLGAATLTLEPGVTMVLWMVGSKCRHSRVRRRALSLLQSLRRQEGLWRSDAVAAILSRVIDIEESGGGGSVSVPSYDFDWTSEETEEEVRRLEEEIARPWDAWSSPELNIPSYETWEDVSIPPEGCRIREFGATLSTERGCLTSKFYMSSEDVSKPGPVREEVAWF